MDADDLALPQRLERQVDFMNKNPEISVSGCYYKVLNSSDISYHPFTNEAIQAELLSKTALAHPTVIFRKEMLIKNGLQYESIFPHAEDYLLWTNCSLAGLKLANIPEVLQHYRTHTGQVSSIYKTQQEESARKIALYFAQKAFDLGDAEIQYSLHWPLITEAIPDLKDYVKAVKWCEFLEIRNHTNGHFKPETLHFFLLNKLQKGFRQISLKKSRPSLKELHWLWRDQRFLQVLDDHKGPWRKIKYLAGLYA
jgi:TPR repeat protein